MELLEVETRRPAQKLGQRLQRGVLKYGTVFVISLRNNFAYVGEAFSRILFLGIILFVLTQLWQAVYSTSGATTLAGFTIQDMLWYLTLTETFATTRTNFNLDIDREVRSGELAYTLSRPYNYLLYQYALQMGSRLIRIAIGLLLASLILITLNGWPSFLQPQNLIAGMILYLLAISVDFLATFLVAIQSFWAEDTSAFALIYARLMMVLGGMLIPLDLLPEPLASITKALPFSYMMYAPAHLTVKFDWAQFGWSSLELVITLLLMAALASWNLRKVERSLSTNGG
jgi:ABC-2 type transport system permease protein